MINAAKVEIYSKQITQLEAENAELKQNLEHYQILLNTYCENLEVHKATIESINLRVADLEAVEKMRDEEIASLREAHGTALVERDALQARIDESEKQNPVCYFRTLDGKLDWDEDCVSVDTACADNYVDMDERYAALPLYTHPFIQPAGMVLVPVELDKATFIGEFKFDIETVCADCYADCYAEGTDIDCHVCNGTGSYQRSVTVPWTTLKEIHKAMLSAAKGE
jgi:hypothetical protein